MVVAEARQLRFISRYFAPKSVLTYEIRKWEPCQRYGCSFRKSDVLAALFDAAIASLPTPNFVDVHLPAFETNERSNVVFYSEKKRTVKGLQPSVRGVHWERGRAGREANAG